MTIHAVCLRFTVLICLDLGPGRGRDFDIRFTPKSDAQWDASRPAIEFQRFLEMLEGRLIDRC